MPDINLICVGKLKEKFYADAMDEYAKRLKAFCRFSCTEIQENKLSDKPSKAEISRSLEKEAAFIQSSLPSDSYQIAMCVEGRSMSSEELAALFEKLFNSGISKISFIIGGSYGLSDEIKNSSGLKLSMSAMTFPHHLARVMVAEQIYRAFKINSGSTYHK